jgi:hypothetical protein
MGRWPPDQIDRSDQYTAGGLARQALHAPGAAGQEAVMQDPDDERPKEPRPLGSLLWVLMGLLLLFAVCLGLTLGGVLTRLWR